MYNTSAMTGKHVILTLTEAIVKTTVVYQPASKISLSWVNFIWDQFDMGHPLSGQMSLGYVE